MVADISVSDRRKVMLNSGRYARRARRINIRRGLSGLVLLGTGVFSAVAQAQNAWAFESMSPAIYRLKQPIEQPFSTVKLTHPPAENAMIQAINVQISPTGSAWVESRLCTADLLNCLPIYGGRLYTKAFNRFAARTPLVVVHEVQSWNGAYPPIYIKVQLNIWW